MAKKNFGNLVDNAREEITQRKIERESIHQLQKQISELEEKMEQATQESVSSEESVPQPAMEEQSQMLENKPAEPEEVKKTFRIYAHLNKAFNIACAKRGVGKGALLNQLIEDWLKANGELQ